MFSFHRNVGLRRRVGNSNPPANRQVEVEVSDVAAAPPVEWEMILANELEPNGIGIADEELVLLASTALLNQSYELEVSGVLEEPDSNIPKDVIAFHPKLFEACKTLRNDPEWGGPARAVLGKANFAMQRYMPASRHFRAAIAFRPNDWRLYEALADSFASLLKPSRSLSALLMAQRLCDEWHRELVRFRLLQKKGQLLVNLSRHREAIPCLEQAMSDYEQVHDQLSPRQIGEAAQAQFLLCSAYVVAEKNRVKYQHHWDQANAKLESLPGHVKRSMNWKARDVAEDSLRRLNDSNSCVGLFCLLLLLVLASFALHGKSFDRRPRSPRTNP